MGQTLRRSFINKILLFTAFLIGIAFQEGYSQTTLSPGDIAIVTVNADGDDNFDFVPLVDLEEDTEIYFTDNAYVENDGLQDNEGTLTYTAPSAISAGTVVSYSGSDENGFLQTSGNYAAAVGGDNLIAYQVDTDTTYLYGVGWARGSTVWQYDPDSSPNNKSDIPPNLSQAGNTILSLGTTDNYQYDGSNGTKGTANTLLALVGNEQNWNEDDDDAFSAFSTNFTLVDPPTLAFTASDFTVSEDDGTAILSVELAEAAGTAVDVDVVFLGSSSISANGDDFGNFSTTTVNFDSEASDNDTETVAINITDDNNFEGDEKAVFQLQNNTEGTIIEPQELTLTIEDDDTPEVVINEILYDPNGTGDDANGDGDLDDGTGDEFVELINNSGSDLDISDWTLSDGAGVKYTFPSGTVIPANKVFVVFSTPAEGTSFGGAYLFASGSSLGLNNGGDNVILKDAEGNKITSVTYSGSQSDESITRNPDITGDFEGHTTADTEGSVFSPGTKVDGTPFGSRFAIGIRGTEGWRMISSPVQNATFDDFFGEFWMQGVTGSDDDSPGNGGGTLFGWEESGGGSYTVPSNMSETVEPGKGYFVYVFEDDEYSNPGIQGGFPKIISTDKTENENTVQVPVSATDEDESGTIDGNEGWSLLGNPFGTDISASAVYNALESEDASANANIYVWDHEGNGNWRLLDGTGDDTIAPFQAFFVRYDAEMSGTITFDKSTFAANTGTEFYKTNFENNAVFNLELHGEEFYDTYSLEFSENGTTDLDRYDAYKLFSLNPNSINLFSKYNNNRLQKNALPIDLESTIEIPLAFEANGRSSLTFRWDSEMQDIPPEWDLILIDEETGREIELRRGEEYSFDVENTEKQQKTSASDENELLNKTNGSQDSRFTLSVKPNIQNTESNDVPESVKLKPNYPNPFNPTTTIPYELTEESDVLLTVWNMIGQKVATLVDGTVEAGTHEVRWNASNMPSGMYIARFEVNGTVFTRKMTLIK